MSQVQFRWENSFDLVGLLFQVLQSLLKVLIGIVFIIRKQARKTFLENHAAIPETTAIKTQDYHDSQRNVSRLTTSLNKWVVHGGSLFPRNPPLVFNVRRIGDDSNCPYIRLHLAVSLKGLWCHVGLGFKMTSDLRLSKSLFPLPFVGKCLARHWSSNDLWAVIFLISRPS